MSKQKTSTRRRRPESKRRSSPLGDFSGSGVIPSEYHCKLKYGYIGGTAASASYTETIFSGSSAFDPGLSSDTKSPVGFTQLAAWYNSYTVKSAHAHVVATLNSTNVAPSATSMGGDIVLYDNASQSAANLLSTALAQPRAKWARLTVASIAKLDLKGSYKTTLGRAAAGFDLSGSTTAGSPSQNWVFHLGFAADAAYTGVNIEFNIVITYDVHFYSRKIVEVAFYERALHDFFLKNGPLFVASKSPFKLTQLSEEEKVNSVDLEVGDIEDVPKRSNLFLSQCGLNPTAGSFEKKADPLPTKSGNVDALLEKARLAQREYSLAHARSQLGAKDGVHTTDGANPATRRWVMVEPAKDSDQLGTSVILNPQIKPPTMPMNGKA